MNGVNIAAMGDVNGDGTLDLIAGTRGGVLANGAAEFGRLAVLDGSAPSGDVTIGSIVTPFGLGYQEGGRRTAGDLDADGKAEIAVTRGGSSRGGGEPKQGRDSEGVQVRERIAQRIAAFGESRQPIEAVFAGITGPDGKVSQLRDARVRLDRGYRWCNAYACDLHSRSLFDPGEYAGSLHRRFLGEHDERAGHGRQHGIGPAAATPSALPWSIMR
ncbi:MAG: VCBS repeat-containing protein [Gemmataceae bacterium]